MDAPASAGEGATAEEIVFVCEQLGSWTYVKQRFSGFGQRAPGL